MSKKTKIDTSNELSVDQIINIIVGLVLLIVLFTASVSLVNSTDPIRYCRKQYGSGEYTDCIYTIPRETLFT